MPTKHLLRLLALAAAVAVAAPAAARADQAAGTPAKAPPAKAGPAARTVEMAVTSEGFVPATVHLKRGERIRLQVTRKTNRTCATEIVIKDLGINQPLPLDQAVTVEFTPRKAGQLRYACAMDMITGVLVVD